MTRLLQMQWLFHLPPSLRCRILSPLENQCHRPAIIARQFSRTALRLRPQSAPKARKLQVSPQSRPPPSPKNAKPPAVQPVARRTGDSLAQYFGDKTQVVLYYAPGHTSFTLVSYLSGALFIGGAVVNASLTNNALEIKWYARSLMSVSSIFLAIIGTAFILAPSKLIRSITLMRTGIGAPAFLRFQMRRSFPGSMAKNQVFDVPVKQAIIDTKGGAYAPFVSIPLEDSQQFTDAVSQGKLKRVSEFSLRSIWYTLCWDVRRMFTRDGMVYVRIGEHGDWKLDLHNAVVLDELRPLEATMRIERLDRTLVRGFKDLIGI